jgi:acyl-coenzyme A thioesterase 9
VTNLLPRLDMLAPLRPVRDIRLSGHVIHTGFSSMEVAVKMDALGNDSSEETLLLGMGVWKNASQPGMKKTVSIC